MIHWHYDHRLWKDQARLRELLRRERGELCEYCRTGLWTQLKHCIFHRRAYAPQYNAAVNLQCVCAACHVGAAHSRENKDRFRELQIGRGYEVDRWISELPLKIHGH